jgi:hypothetical protein
MQYLCQKEFRCFGILSADVLITLGIVAWTTGSRWILSGMLLLWAFGILCKGAEFGCGQWFVTGLDDIVVF